ncbi:MAG: high-affinity branched-chain amino acid ABC transporter ATP-binding protein LivG [Spirochaetes bacterium]|nr:MAG: high-affinity branched-chain amino acid ABC transporter ATP-binding protein LivG [Spirochaetota bacterium]
MPLLEVKNLTIYFGGLRAVHNYNVTFEPGQVRGLIGPNGAGKTTTFNMITGIHRPTSGEIIFEGQNIVGMMPHDIASMGIARTFQNMRLWRHMTVMEHIKLAMYSKIEYGLIGAFFGTPKRHKQETEFDEKAYHFLKLLNVDRYTNQVVTGLPYGVQRRVEMARALAIVPKILLLDEPTAGMNPEEMLDMVEVIRQIKDELKLTIFLIEHRMRVVMDLCEIIQTLDFGEIIAEGTPDEIRNNERVIEAYLGKEVEV